MDSDSPAAVRVELRGVEEELAQLRENAATLRRQIGDHCDDLTDPVEKTELVTLVEEQEALIEELENRREDLLRRLGEHR
jgi:bacterioferritin (cytochrome b1)